MTAPLEVLRGLSDAMESAHDYLPVTALTIRAAIAAIEERDAEIEKARREVRRTASRLQRTHRNAARFADDAAKATARFKAAVKRALQDSEKIATLTRQLAEMDKEASVQRERANGLEYACECAEKQRDAMRGALENALRDVRNMFPDDDEAHVDHCVCTRCRIRKTLVSR